MSADYVIKSNCMFTGLEKEPCPGGVAIKGNKIVAVGPYDVVDAEIGDDTKVYEFEDKLLLPGLVESHAHFIEGAMAESKYFVENLEKFIDLEREKGKFSGKLSFEHPAENGFLTSLIYNLLPIFLIVAVWMFFMRRMGSGGGAGFGGGIFNVGKSKAQMYEKGGDLGITFKDVAGQAGAKQEMQEIVDFCGQGDQDDNGRGGNRRLR